MLLGLRAINGLKHGGALWVIRKFIKSFNLILQCQIVIDNKNIDIKARYSHAYVGSFGESKDFSCFSENTDTLTINADFEHPLELSFRGNPLSGVLHLEHTAFLGPDRDLTGFTYLSGLGFSIKTNVSKMDWHVESLQFGAKYLTGDNVRGWSLIFGYRF